MNTMTIGMIAQRLGERLAEREADEADHWGRVRLVASAIPSDADLDDDDDVIRALFAARLCNDDFGEVLDEAIALCRERRAP